MFRAYGEAITSHDQFVTRHGRSVVVCVPDRFKNVDGRYPNVAGGRWSVRKFHVRPGQKPWRAWTNGKAHILNRSFFTHAEAVAWATMAAQVVKSGDQQAYDAMYRLKVDTRGRRVI